MSTLNVLNELTTAEKLSLHDHLHTDEMDAIVYSLLGNTHALALTLFLYDTGCRPTEAAKLRCHWVMPYDNSAIVQHHGRTRPIRYGAYTAETLAKWIKARPKVGHDRVFFDPMTYQPFNREGLVKYFGQLLVSINRQRPGLSIHSFRSSFGLRIMDATPPKAVRFMLGLPGSQNAGVVYGEDISAGFECVAYERKRHTLIEQLKREYAAR